MEKAAESKSFGQPDEVRERIDPRGATVGRATFEPAGSGLLRSSL